MKFLEKVKNMFTEEVEEEVKPIKTEIRKIEIPVPTKPQTTEIKPVTEEKAPEVDNSKKEEKFKFPVYFDDKDFDKLPKSGEKKEEPKKEVKQQPKTPPKEATRKEVYGGKNPAISAVTKEEKKTFKPTPIISPVYGILDKNYKKEDITPKKRVSEPHSSKKLTIDDIRNKAFGTLEDELETTLFGKNSSLNNKIETEEEPLDLFDELDIKVEEPRHGKVEETVKEVIPSRTLKNKELELLNEVENLGQIVVNERPEQSVIPKEISIEEEINQEETIQEENKKEETVKETESETNMIEDEMDKICSETEDEELELTESDLFNLIDSMYEKKDGEE